MCDGFSEASLLSAAMLGSSVGGTALAVEATNEQADAQHNMAQYQAQVAADNQAIAEQTAQDDLSQAAAAQQQQQMQTAAKLGAQRAQLAADGVALDGGSALDVQSDTAMLGELNALSVRSDGQDQAYSALAQAMDDGAQSGLDDFKAANAEQSGALADARTLLGATGSTMNQTPY